MPQVPHDRATEAAADGLLPDLGRAAEASRITELPSIADAHLSMPRLGRNVRYRTYSADYYGTARSLRRLTGKLCDEHLLAQNIPFRTVTGRLQLALNWSI